MPVEKALMTSSSKLRRMIQLGLCCINVTLRRQAGVVPNRSLPVAALRGKDGWSALKKISLQNLNDVIPMIEWNEKMGIRVMRLSSAMIPHRVTAGSPDFDIDFARPALARIGDTARKYGHRLTFHVSQYNLLGTPDARTHTRTIKDLSHHADMLDAIGAGRDGVMFMHGGGLYGDKARTMQRWCNRYERLPERIRRRLVIKNCERNFSIRDCLQMSAKVGVPVVFDNLHFYWYRRLHPNEPFDPPASYVADVLKSWGDIKPKFHVSQQHHTGRNGRHSGYVDRLPEYLLDVPEKHGRAIDVMVEAKRKELAVLNLYHRYPFFVPENKREDIDAFRKIIAIEKRIAMNG